MLEKGQRIYFMPTTVYNMAEKTVAQTLKASFPPRTIHGHRYARPCNGAGRGEVPYKMLTDKKLLIICFCLFVNGCAHGMLQLYEGSERPRHDIAVLKPEWGTGLVLRSVDDKEVLAHSGSFGGSRSVAVMPGQHIIVISYGYPLNLTVKPAILRVNLQAGREYIIKRVSYNRSGEMRLKVVDSESGEEVSY